MAIRETRSKQRLISLLDGFERPAVHKPALFGLPPGLPRGSEPSGQAPGGQGPPGDGKARAEAREIGSDSQL